MLTSPVAYGGGRCEAIPARSETASASLLRRFDAGSTLPRDGAKKWEFGTYCAADYDELIDHPVEMGTFTLASFRAGGVLHEIAVTGRQNA